MLIVGSKSLIHHFKDMSRIPRDIDLISYKSDVKSISDLLSPSSIEIGNGILTLVNIANKNDIFNTNNIEILIADESESLKKYLEYEHIENGCKYFKYASVEVLYSLKRSHIHFPIHFNKHITDYCFLNKFLNGIDILKDITKINYIETENRIGKLKTPSLNKSVKEFFDQSSKYVEYYFIHDDIHKAVSHYDKPLYSYMQKDPSIVKCEKYLWNGFSYEDKCKCILEEAYVIALERKVLPGIFGGQKWVSSEEAINWSLMRVCTNLCSGWFREFATDNYFSIKEFINKNYVENFLEKYNKGEIKKIN